MTAKEAIKNVLRVGGAMTIEEIAAATNRSEAVTRVWLDSLAIEHEVREMPPRLWVRNEA